MKKRKKIKTSTGQEVLERFYMSKTFWHEGWVWIFSVVDGYAIASEHETGDDKNMGGNYYRGKFKLDHDRQLLEKYNKAVKEEEDKRLLIKEETIDDRTDESRYILRETGRLNPSD